MRKAEIVATGAIVVTVLTAVVCWFAWRALARLPAGTLAALVLAMAVLLPIGAYVAWRLGRYEAQAVIRGMEEVGKQVMSDAERIASLRVAAHRAQRQPQGPVVVMPIGLPPIVHRSLEGPTDTTVDL